MNARIAVGFDPSFEEFSALGVQRWRYNFDRLIIRKYTIGYGDDGVRHLLILYIVECKKDHHVVIQWLTLAEVRFGIGLALKQKRVTYKLIKED